MNACAALIEAVEALHAVNSTSDVRAAANKFLVEFMMDPSAPAAAEAILATGTHSEPVLTFAASLFGRAAVTMGAPAIQSLLGYCAGLTCRSAVASLAGALARVVCANRMEAVLLSSTDFSRLRPSRQVMVLQALADTLEEQASAEELMARPSVVEASCVAASLLEHTLLSADSTVDSEAALRCLRSWTGCGIGYATLIVRHELHCALLRAMMCQQGANGSHLPHAALAAGVIRSSLQASLELGDELGAEACEPIQQALSEWAPRVESLGAPCPDAAGQASDGSEIAGELASTLCGIAGLCLEIGAEGGTLDEGEGDEECGSAGKPPSSIRPTLDLLMNGSRHPLPVAAEVAAEGWINLGAVWPASNRQPVGGPPGGDWRKALWLHVAQRTIARASLAQRRQGTGEDVDDVLAWRERCATPLLSTCSEQLGASAWLATLLPSLRAAVHSSPSDLEGLEALLYAAACTSPRCGTPADANDPLRAASAEVASIAAEVHAFYEASPPAASDALSSAVASQAAACARTFGS